jgi:hypothetical protein
MGASGCSQPISQRKQIMGHGSKSANFFVALPVGCEKNETSDNHLLMDIQSAATLIDNLHPVPPL